MTDRDGYHLDIVVASVLRIGLLVGVLAIMALTSACSPSRPLDLSFDKSNDNRQFLADGSNDQTRSHIPQRGCDEKSDSSLKRPLL
jgi:hypothetical protein